MQRQWPMCDRHNPANRKKETKRSPLHVKTDLILTIVTYRTDVNHSWAPERKTNNHNVRFPVTWGCFLTNNSSSILLVLRCRSASNFSLTYHCLNVQAMIKMIRIGIWVLILGGSVAERVSALDLQSEEPGFNTRPNRLLDLFKSSTKVVNIQLVFLYPVGIVSLVTFISQFQVVSSLCFKTKLKCAKSLILKRFFNSQANETHFHKWGLAHGLAFLKWGLFEYGNGLFDLFLSVVCSVSPALAR